MDIDQALCFLKEHQPLPSDAEINDGEIKTLKEVRKFFLENPHPDCIPLFLNVFGSGSGFGVYQLIEDVIVQFSNDQVTPYLMKSLRSIQPGIRYWSAQIALSFPNKMLIEPLSEMIYEQNSDLRLAAYVALGEINHKSVLLTLEKALSVEKEQENYEILKEILNNYGELDKNSNL